MANNRMNKINEEIRAELSKLIRTVKDPRVRGLITVTSADTTGDLRTARIFISVLDKKDTAEVLDGLRSASGYLRKTLGASMALRHTPELLFLADESIGSGAHILDILKNLETAKGESE